MAINLAARGLILGQRREHPHRRHRGAGGAVGVRRRYPPSKAWASFEPADHRRPGRRSILRWGIPSRLRLPPPPWCGPVAGATPGMQSPGRAVRSNAASDSLSLLTRLLDDGGSAPVNQARMPTFARSTRRHRAAKRCARQSRANVSGIRISPPAMRLQLYKTYQSRTLSLHADRRDHRGEPVRSEPGVQWPGTLPPLLPPGQLGHGDGPAAGRRVPVHGLATMRGRQVGSEPSLTIRSTSISHVGSVCGPIDNKRGDEAPGSPGLPGAVDPGIDHRRQRPGRAG